MIDWAKEDFRGWKVTVAGLGTFGGQLAAARFFASKGAAVTVTDRKGAEALAESLSRIADLPARLVLGGHDEGDFTGADLIVASPAIPENSPYLAAAAAAGVPVTHEMDMFFHLCRAPIVAVTGSNGKSTTTALLAHILEKTAAVGGKRKVYLGGNIGHSLLLEVSEMTGDDIVVLELSSFQLEDLGEAGMSPHGAVVTNLSPNHLDRHGTFENYAAAKRNITRHQGREDFLVLNADDENLRGWEDTRAQVIFFGKYGENMRDGVYISGRSVVNVLEGMESAVTLGPGWKLMGAHNMLNLAAAAAAAWKTGVPVADAAAAAEDFAPLPHRIEYVTTVNGVDFYNDSIATTPESVDVALASFDKPVVLIAGGYDKGVDLESFSAKAALKIKALAAIGATGRKIADAAAAARPGLKVILPGDFREAVREAFALADPGDVVLLSPACASYDMFDNFQQRGDLFRQYAKELGAGTGTRNK